MKTLLCASVCCLSFSLKSHHHIQRPLSQWKERLFFPPSTLALFPTVAIIQTSAHFVLGNHEHRAGSWNHISECWPTPQQRGIMSQCPELWHLLKQNSLVKYFQRFVETIFGGWAILGIGIGGRSGHILIDRYWLKQCWSKSKPVFTELYCALSS